MHPDVKLPVYATDGSGCFDIFADNYDKFSHNSLTYSTGLKFEIPEGYVMLVFSRSGHGFNKDIRLANCVGVIDSDYRGELKVKLTLDAPCAGDPMPPRGERIAQALIAPVPKIEFNEVTSLSTTQRGEGGLGSTN
jgi:dUTP pyrophosphatase